MALTLEELQSIREGIIREMALPLEQHFGDQGVTRRSMKDLVAALNQVDNAIAGIIGDETGITPTRITRIRTQQGY